MRNTLVTLVLGLALLAGCASEPPKPDVDYKQDYDFSRIKTFSFLSTLDHASGPSSKAFISDIQINRVNEAMIDAMTAKGYRYVDDAFQADILLSWHLYAQDKQDVRTYNTGPSMGGGYYGGYRGYNRRASYNCWNCGGTEVRVRNYTQGTYIVDLIDPTMNQSVWRAVIQSKIKEDSISDQQEVNEGVNRVMASFPPY